VMGQSLQYHVGGGAPELVNDAIFGRK